MIKIGMEQRLSHRQIKGSSVPAELPQSIGEPGIKTDQVTKDFPKTIQGGVVNGKAISLTKPGYPAAAKAVQASGSVAVHVLIAEDGTLFSAEAVTVHPLLRAAARSAACSSKFAPTLLSGQPVKVSRVITYNFVP
jgi:outer membrane biosynthesis protein TonB